MKTSLSRLPGKLLISNPEQLKELTSPVKQVIVDALVFAQKPCSIKEIAERINRAPDSLYYHFRSLVKAGLIVEAESREEFGKPVSLYLPVARMIKIKYDFRIPGFKQLICRIFNAAVRLATRDFQRGVELEHVRCDSNVRNLFMSRMEAWLTRDQISEVNRRIDEIVEIMCENAEPNSGERCSVLMAISPQETRQS